MRNNLLLVISILLLMTLPVGARIIPDVPKFIRYNPGDIPTAAGYNADVENCCNYINDNIVAALNVLTGQDKGAMYTYDALTQTMGVIPGPTNNDDVLTADSTAASGMSYKAPTALSVNVFKGDITVQDGLDNLTRLGVGANGTILTADATALTGLKWLPKDLSGVYPTGAIVAWSPAAAGTARRSASRRTPPPPPEPRRSPQPAEPAGRGVVPSGTALASSRPFQARRLPPGSIAPTISRPLRRVSNTTPIRCSAIRR